MILIGLGHFDNKPAEGEETFKRTVRNRITDGVYFTTTQLSTIGYGDITPKSNTAKNICSIVHIFIIAISLKLFSEYCIMNEIDKVQKEAATDLLEIEKRKSFLDSVSLRFPYKK